MAPYKELAFPSQTAENATNTYQTPLCFTEDDRSLLSIRENHILDLLNQGYSEYDIAQFVQEDIRYVLGCIDRFMFIKTPAPGETAAKVKALIMLGYGRAEIASQVFISINTASNYISMLTKPFGPDSQDNLLLDAAMDRMAPQYISVQLERGQDSEDDQFRLPAERFLTPREYETARLFVQEQLSYEEIAKKLDIEIISVKTYMFKALHKIGVKRRQELNLDTLELFCPHNLYVQKNQSADTIPLTLAQRSLLLPDISCNAIVPLAPQEVLTETELKIFTHLAAFPDVKDIDPQMLRGLNPAQITSVEIAHASQKCAAKSNTELSELLRMNKDTLKGALVRIMDKLNIFTRKDAVLLYRFYREEGIL